MRTAEGGETDGTTPTCVRSPSNKNRGIRRLPQSLLPAQPPSPCLPIILNKDRPHPHPSVQGPLVQEWAQQTSRWLDTLDPVTEDTLNTWNQFITQFEASFDNTQKVQKARNQLDRLTMKWSEVDQYTMDFKN